MEKFAKDLEDTCVNFYDEVKAWLSAIFLFTAILISLLAHLYLNYYRD